MTPYERLTGKKWRRPICEIGETVLAELTLRRTYKGTITRQTRQIARRAVRGVWCGQATRTGERLIIKNNRDAIRCRTIRRVP